MTVLATLAAVVALAVWMVGQREALRGVTASNDDLRQKIATARAMSGQKDVSIADRRIAELKQRSVTAKDIDWRKAAEWIAREETGSGPSRDLGQLRLALFDFSPVDLDAALDALDALDLPAHVSDQLRWMVGDVLGPKDPQRLLDRWHGALDERHSSTQWRLGLTFQNWAARDPATAAAWIDQRVADGSLEARALDGVNHARLNFEAAVLVARIGQPAADQRLAQLPEEQREQALARLTEHQIRPGTEADYVEIIRRQLEPARQTQAITRIARVVMKRGGLAAANELLDQAGLDDTQTRTILESIQPAQP